MRQVILYVSLICGTLTYRDVLAQGFWYVPPGYEYGSYNGIDFGNGVWFGYGYGFGLALTPDPATGFVGSNFVQIPEENDETTWQSMDDTENSIGSDVRNVHKWKKVAAAKKHALALKQAKSAVHGQSPVSNKSLRLTSAQEDPSAGKIVWPSVLLRDSFSVERFEIESLLKSSHQQGVRSEVGGTIARKAQAMHQELRKHIHEVDVKEYLEALRFLGGLS